MFTRHRVFKVMTALLVLLGLLVGTTGVTPASAATPHYAITAAHSLEILNVEGGSTANGARIIQWPNGGTNVTPNEQWIFIAVAGAQDTYYIQSVGSGKVIEIATLAAGAQVIQHSLYYGTNQQWVQVRLAGNLVKFRNVATGLYLDVSGYSYNAGAPLTVWYQTSGQNQQFFLGELS